MPGTHDHGLAQKLENVLKLIFLGGNYYSVKVASPVASLGYPRTELAVPSLSWSAPGLSPWVSPLFYALFLLSHPVL